jgi:hypothetical protein
MLRTSSDRVEGDEVAVKEEEEEEVVEEVEEAVTT